MRPGLPFPPTGGRGRFRLRATYFCRWAKVGKNQPGGNSRAASGTARAPSRPTPFPPGPPGAPPRDKGGDLRPVAARRSLSSGRSLLPRVGRSPGTLERSAATVSFWHALRADPGGGCELFESDRRIRRCFPLAMPCFPNLLPSPARSACKKWEVSAERATTSERREARGTEGRL